MSGRTFTREAFHEETRRARAEGPTVTSRAEQEQRRTGRMDPLVDPAGHGVIRRSISRKDKQGKYWVLTMGTAIPVELRLDTTASMGDNVDRAFNVLPDTFALLAQVPGAVLGRYDTQVCNSIFNDEDDPGPVLCRTQFEMDVEIARQLRLMIPVRQGGDEPEDPQYGMFGSTYLTAAEIHKFGLKGYDFTVTDATAHGDVKLSVLRRVFGDDVLDKVHENGHEMSERDLPQMDQIIQEMLNYSHAFLLSVGGGNVRFWESYYGSERVVVLPRTELLPHVQAAIIGLTEGTLNLQSVEHFLVKSGGLKKGDASQVLDAVAGIPIGAQAALPNFSKIPMKGDRFKDKTDPWPIPADQVEVDVEEEPGKGSGMWK